MDGGWQFVKFLKGVTSKGGTDVQCIWEYWMCEGGGGKGVKMLL